MRDSKIFFATDIHGSDRCLRKFLNAGKFYGVDAVVMGGDITGKMIVPIVNRGQGAHTATLYGRKIDVTDDGMAKLRKTITDAGFYAYETTPEEGLIDLGDGITMISVGYSNKTPWDSPRELPEDELAAYIARQAESLGNTDRVIFNFHVPPRDTPIDQAVLRTRNSVRS